MGIATEIEDQLRHLLMKSLSRQNARLSRDAVDGLVCFESAQMAEWLINKYATECGKFVEGEKGEGV